jgi:hypothetical protein
MRATLALDTEKHMPSNLERFKKDLKDLIDRGDNLQNAIQYESHPEEFREQLETLVEDKKKVGDFIKALPSFRTKYQTWYSEALAIVKLILPDRLVDFIRLYEKPKGRKLVEYGNYVIEDYLQNLAVTFPDGSKKVGPYAAIPQFEQQLNILKAVERRFESSLFDIKQLTQADLFDSELEAARELNKRGFTRGAGAIAGVVLEKHLAQVCDSHAVVVTRKDPSISDLNDLLKSGGVIDIPQWRSNQHLADLRNLCDHNKKVEPTKEQVEDLIAGVEKVTKTLF